MNVTPKMLTLLKQIKASPNRAMPVPYRKGASNTFRACARWGLIHPPTHGWLTLSAFGEAYLMQRGE